jgi:putative transposase
LDYLKFKNHFVKGFVIMPNHLHVLIEFSSSQKSITTIVSNGKRFMAYELVKRLQEERKNEILKKLGDAAISSDKDRGTKHQIFERSFDCKPITSEHFFLEKLNYIHNNPCSGVWKLVENPVDYKHSSAKYHMSGIQSDYPIIVDQLIGRVLHPHKRLGGETRPGRSIQIKRDVLQPTFKNKN